MPPKRILCTVTNDLTTDQRMQRICSTLVRHGFEVMLIGRVVPNSKPLVEAIFEQKRLTCFFNKGFLFYTEYNLRLLAYLLFARYDTVCSVDLDTLAAGCLATLVRRKRRVFDAHEYFTEVPEVTDRPFVKGFWGGIARICLPFYARAYTVSAGLRDIFEEKYGIKFGLVRNMPLYQPLENKSLALPDSPKIILYQGALNEGRGIEQMLEAMTQLDGVEFWLAGEGDLSVFLRQKAQALKVGDKVRFLGNLHPSELRDVTRKAWLGINLLENKGLSYYYSLANKFFDYVQACVPGLTVDFPEYQTLCNEFPVAVLLKDIEPQTIVEAVKHLQNNPEQYKLLQNACLRAREVWTWEKEEAVLLKYFTD